MTDTAKLLVSQQAEDAGLWFDARTAPEVYLQHALRKLHYAVEYDAAHEPRIEQLDRQLKTAWKLYAERGHRIAELERELARPPDAPAQPSTATQAPAPSEEGVGQGGVALVERLYEWAQNEEMIDQYYTAHGEDCVKAAGLIKRFERELAALRQWLAEARYILRGGEG
jgi:hypothetical protein